MRPNRLLVRGPGWLGLVLILFLTCGCFRMGPRYSPPVPEPAPPRSFQFAPQTPAAAQESFALDQWWRSWDDPEIEALVRLTLVRNLDLVTAAARIKAALARVEQAGAGLLPALNLEAQGQTSRSSVAFNRSGLTGQVDRTTESYNLSLAAAYEVDLWGRIRAGRGAAVADLLQARENRWTLAQSLVAESVTALLRARALARRLDVATRLVEAQVRTLSLVEGRYQRGLTSILDVRQARRSLARSRSQIPSLRQELGTTFQRLAVLTGRYPRVPDLAPLAQDPTPELSPIPAGLPSDLLRRRPDIRAAEAALHAASQRTGQARAARFPVISLTGRLGFSSDELGELFTDESNLWSLALGVSAPLYDGGLRSAREREAKAATESLAAEYALTLLTAFREVETALLTEQEQRKRRDHLALALVEAIATQEAALNRYQRGLADYLRVLEAQQTRFQVEDDLVLTELALWTNRVALHRALGGGWAKPEPAVKAVSGKTP